VRRALALVLPLALAATAAASDQPSADALLSSARATAKRQGKNVLVVFHASWCGWCKRLDAFLSDPKMKALVEKGLVVVHLDVQESEGKKSLENPGGNELLTSLNGAGLPFYAILDKNGKPVIDSNAKPGDKRSNVGYPAAPEEIGHFLRMLEKGAPKLTASDRERVRYWLRANAPK
jgi:thiol-disulfide isomerase/thioredoxin